MWFTQLLSSLGHRGLHPKHTCRDAQAPVALPDWCNGSRPTFTARQGTQQVFMATSHGPRWRNNCKIWRCLLNHSNWKRKHSRRTLKIAPCSPEAAAAFEDFSRCKALRTTHPPPAFLPAPHPSALHFNYFSFSLFKCRLKDLKEERWKASLVLPTDHSLDFFVLHMQAVN